MKTSTIQKSLLVLIVGTTLLISCSKEDTKQIVQTQEVQFGFSNSLHESEAGRATANEAIPQSVVVTVIDTDGEIVLNRMQLALYQFGELLLSAPVTLQIGNYALTEFMVLDESNIVYVTPIEESSKAHLVDDPLAIEFNVYHNDITTVTPEVLFVEESDNAIEYGYGQFGFELVETVNLVISVFSMEENNFELTNAEVTISGIDESEEVVWTYSTDLEALANELELRKATSYAIEVTKNGYADWSQVIEITDESHLIEVILEKEDTFDVIWSKAYGGSENDVYNSVIGLEDGILLAGSSFSIDGDIPDNNGYSDGIVTRLDIDGNIVWSRNYGSDRPDNVNTIIESKDGDGYIVVGTSNRRRGKADIWVFKIDLNGNMLWERIYGGLNSHEWARKVVQTSRGYLVGGSSYETNEILLLEIDETGVPIWDDIRRYDKGQDIFGLEASKDGGYVIGSHYLDNYSSPSHKTLFKISQSGDEVWSTQFNASNRPTTLFENGENYWVAYSSEMIQFDLEGNYVGTFGLEVDIKSASQDGNQMILVGNMDGDGWIGVLNANMSLDNEVIEELDFESISGVARVGSDVFCVGYTLSSEVEGYRGSRDQWVVKLSK